MLPIDKWFSFSPSEKVRNTASLAFKSCLAFPLEYTWHFSLAFRRRNASKQCYVYSNAKKRNAIRTRVILFYLECFSCKNAYAMQGCRAGTGAAGTICSEPKSESDIKSGAATAPRKVVSNSYQTYRTTWGTKWTNFRLSAPLDQALLPSSSPRKRRLHSLQNSKRLLRTLHLICMWQNHAAGVIGQVNRSPERTTVHIQYLTCIWPARFRNSRSK